MSDIGLLETAADAEALLKSLKANAEGNWDHAQER